MYTFIFEIVAVDVCDGYCSISALLNPFVERKNPKQRGLSRTYCQIPSFCIQNPFFFVDPLLSSSLFVAFLLLLLLSSSLFCLPLSTLFFLLLSSLPFFFFSFPSSFELTEWSSHATWLSFVLLSYFPRIADLFLCEDVVNPPLSTPPPPHTHTHLSACRFFSRCICIRDGFYYNQYITIIIDTHIHYFVPHVDHLTVLETIRW